MALVPSESVDLVVTSPPYWNVVAYKGPEGDISNIADKRLFFTEISKVWKECHRVLKPGGHLAVNFADVYMTSQKLECVVPDMIESVGDGFYLQNRIIWRKYEPGAGVGRLPITDYQNVKSGLVEPMSLFNWEYVFVWKKPGVRRWNFELSRSEWYSYSDGVWYINSSREAGACEVIPGGAVFPPELPMRLIKIYTQRGDVVLDPFAGTGTVMLAAFKTRRSCWLYEIRPEMLKVIKEKVPFGQKAFDAEVEWKVWA
jgi:site-specific DNA-methyltransferase (adenine-specific)